MSTEQLVVISHTHWDREWYLPFEVFRTRLVALMDRLLDILRDKPDFRFFMLDGQAIVLADYLTVRPEREEEIRRHVTDGRLLVGPWYVQPDELLVSGEALVRNLLIGHRLAGRFGGVMDVGYLPDSFGHTAQMPQILRGFAIDSAVVWRGVPSEVWQDQFTWRAPEGSEVLAGYVSLGYGNMGHLPAETEQLQETIASLREALGSRALTPYILVMNGGDHLLPQANLPAIVATANEHLSDAVLLQGTLPRFFADVRRVAAQQGTQFQVVEGELRAMGTAALLPGVVSARMWIKQRNAASQTALERWAEPFSVYSDLAAGQNGDARALLDLAWRYLLQNHAHDSICGCGIDQVHAEMRTRFDAVDQIAGELTERALADIAGRVNTQAVPHPAGYGRPTVDASAGALVVFNSEGGPRTDYVVASVQLPSGVDDVAVADPDGRLLPCQTLNETKVEEYSRTLNRSQLRGLLRLAGGNREWTADRARSLYQMVKVMAGSKLPDLVVEDVAIRPGINPDTVIVEARTAASGDHNYEALAAALRDVSALTARGDVEYVHLRALRRDAVELGFVAEEVPGHGYRTFQLLRGHRHGPRARVPLPGDNIENEFFSVRANVDDGTISVIDKETGAVSTGLNAFVDAGDAGDEYNYAAPANDTVMQGPDGPVEVEVLEDGPVRWRLRLALAMALPVGLSHSRDSRSVETVRCPLATEVSLYAHVRRIDITTVFDNRASDHRLRALFPTRIQVDHSHAEAQFATIERPVRLPGAKATWLESPIGTYPQFRFVDVSDGEVGLAIANRGLPEYEVLPGRDGVSIALTLLRCVGWLSRDDLPTRRGGAGPALPTPGAQLLGTHTFDYALLPHAGDWEQVLAQAHAFASPLRTVGTPLHLGSLPSGASFVSIQPASLVLSAVKDAEDGDGVIVRLYNPSTAHALARIETLWPLEGSEIVDLRERHVGDLQPEGSVIGLPIRAAQIVTIRLRFADMANRRQLPDIRA
ncbi:MAG: alpha-mannosidase [Chloroflexota bacterium]